MGEIYYSIYKKAGKQWAEILYFIFDSSAESRRHRRNVNGKAYGDFIAATEALSDTQVGKCE
jgi:hypothetical protein